MKRMRMWVLTMGMCAGLLTSTARVGWAQPLDDKMESHGQMAGDKMSGGEAPRATMAGDKMDKGKKTKKSSKKDKMAAGNKMTDKGKMDDHSKMSDQK